MMKQLIPLICSLLLMSQLKAQNFTMGIHTGATATKMLWAHKIDNNPFSAITTLPKTRFGVSVGTGLISDFHLNSRLYIPIQLDFHQKRYAIETEGGIAAVINDQGIISFVQTNTIDYRLNQIGLSSGIGINFNSHLAVELQPFFHSSLTHQEARVSADFPWEETRDFKQSFDYGVAAYCKGNYKRLYLKAGYQFGLREIKEFSIYDLEFFPIGKLAVRNTMFLLIVGYRIIA